MRRTAELTLVPQPLQHDAERAYVAIAKIDEAEGIFTVLGPHGERLPIVAIDDKGLALLRRFAQETATKSGKSVDIMCFTQRLLYETLRPITTGSKE